MSYYFTGKLMLSRSDGLEKEEFYGTLICTMIYSENKGFSFQGNCSEEILISEYPSPRLPFWLSNQAAI